MYEYYFFEDGSVNMPRGASTKKKKSIQRPSPSARARSRPSARARSRPSARRLSNRKLRRDGSRQTRRQRKSDSETRYRGSDKFSEAFIQKFVRESEWNETGNKYENIVILTMNTGKAEIETICSELFKPKHVTVFARNDLLAQKNQRGFQEKFNECYNFFLSQFIINSAPEDIMSRLMSHLEQLFSKLWMASTLYKATGNIYFTDDSFSKTTVELCLPFIDNSNPSWLVYQQAVPEHNDHVRKYEGYSTWCIDFDGTITKSLSKINVDEYQTMLRFVNLPTFNFDELLQKAGITDAEKKSLELFEE